MVLLTYTYERFLTGARYVMKTLSCNRIGCFYCAKGKCTSITAVVGGAACSQFLPNSLATFKTRRTPLPRRLDLASIREHLTDDDQNDCHLA